MALPNFVQEDLDRYIEYGIMPGHFLQAVIRNDLFDAMARADDTHAEALKDIVTYLVNEAPIGCLGSRDALLDWVHDGGRQGQKIMATCTVILKLPLIN